MIKSVQKLLNYKGNKHISCGDDVLVSAIVNSIYNPKDSYYVYEYSYMSEGDWCIFVKCVELYKGALGREFYALAGRGDIDVEVRLQQYQKYAQKHNFIPVSINEIPRIQFNDGYFSLPPRGFVEGL